MVRITLLKSLYSVRVSPIMIMDADSIAPSILNWQKNGHAPQVAMVMPIGIKWNWQDLMYSTSTHRSITY